MPTQPRSPLLIKASLEGSRTVRHFLLPPDSTLHDLHLALQGTFGFWNTHLHQFTETQNGHPYLYGDYSDPETDQTRSLNEKRYRLDVLEQRLNRPDARLMGQVAAAITGQPAPTITTSLSYLYDFGARWQIGLHLQQTTLDAGHAYTCIAARGVAPCENSGGVDDYRRKAKSRDRQTRQWLRFMRHDPKAPVTIHSVQQSWDDFRQGRPERLGPDERVLDTNQD